jgi:hypothetical protein
MLAGLDELHYLKAELKDRTEAADFWERQAIGWKRLYDARKALHLRQAGHV